jgi:hypothetical protein
MLNLPTMRLKLSIQLLLTIIAVTGAVLVLQSSGTIEKSKPCRESMDSRCEKKAGSDKMIWENLSQQFFSSL